jgi:hypothetical protein
VAIDRTDADARLARIEQIIAEFRAARQRQLLRRVMWLRRLAEASAARTVAQILPRVH